MDDPLHAFSYKKSCQLIGNGNFQSSKQQFRFTIYGCYIEAPLYETHIIDPFVVAENGKNAPNPNYTKFQ